MSQLFLASTFFGAMNLAAAIDQGVFDDQGRQHRVLLVSSNASMPESAGRLEAVPGFDVLRQRFDDVVDWNGVVAPYHPSQFTNFGEPAIVARLLSSHLHLDDKPVELVLESIQVSPARALADLFVSARVTMYSDGLMSFGPTRVALPPSLGRRIDRLVYLDLIPGLRPVLLSEFDVALVPLVDDAFKGVVEEVASASTASIDVAGQLGEVGATALVVGQYLGSLGIVTETEERQMYVDTIKALGRLGHRTVAFKAHPTAPASVERLVDDVAIEGIQVVEVRRDVSAEQLLARWQPAIIAGCFSTALVVARRFYGVDAVSFGTGKIMDRLQPFENSNRVPLTLIDATIPRFDRATERILPPRIDPAGSAPLLQDTVDLVAYAMQPRVYAHRTDEIVDDLALRVPSTLRRRYVDGPRAVRIGLPGAEMRLRRRVKLTVRDGLEAMSPTINRWPMLARTARRVRMRTWPYVDRWYRRSPRIRRLTRRIIK